MANEFIHIDPGAILTKAEFELITGHQFNSQATGDILYASTSTQLSRLGVGSNTNVLEITGGVPAWVASSGTGSVARVTSPTFVTPALGTPSALVGTNISGTASSLTAGTVTTNANLTGHVTSSGNAAVLGSFTSAQLATALTNETGSGLAVFGTSPTLVTPALGTPASGVMTNVSGTAASLTAGAATALATARTIGGTSFDGTGNIAITTNANLTGVVTSSGNATAIADKALAIAKLADGTDGELITWNASGVIAAVAVGSADEVLTSNGSGAAPTFQAAGGGGAVAREGGDTTDATTTSTSQGDLLSVSSLSIAAAIPVLFIAEARKTTGAASYADLGLKLNAVSIHAATGGGGFWTTDGSDELQHGGFNFYLFPRVTSYQYGLAGSYTVYDAVGLSRSGHGAKITNALPIATITDFIITGSTGNTSITLGTDELHVYSMAVS